MRATIDRAGRFVVPKAIRDRLQLTGTTEVDVEENDGVIEVRPVPAAVMIRGVRAARTYDVLGVNFELVGT